MNDIDLMIMYTGLVYVWLGSNKQRHGKSSTASSRPEGWKGDICYMITASKTGLRDLFEYILDSSPRCASHDHMSLTEALG